MNETLVRDLCEQFSPQFNDKTLPYFGNFFIQFSIIYLEIYKVISIIIIIFGLITNFLLLGVLTRKKMASPSNTFLIGISVADTTVLIVHFFIWIPLINYNQISYEMAFWFVALFPPYCVFR